MCLGEAALFHLGENSLSLMKLQGVFVFGFIICLPDECSPKRALYREGSGRFMDGDKTYNTNSMCLRRGIVSN